MLSGTKVRNIAPEYLAGTAEDEGAFRASAKAQAQLTIP